MVKSRIKYFNPSNPILSLVDYIGFGGSSIEKTSDYSVFVAVYASKAEQVEAGQKRKATDNAKWDGLSLPGLKRLSSY